MRCNCINNKVNLTLNSLNSTLLLPSITFFPSFLKLAETIFVIPLLKYSVSLSSSALLYSDSYTLNQKTSFVIVVTSLPFSGADVLSFAFENVSDYLYLADDQITVPPPPDGYYETDSFDICVWPTQVANVRG